MTNRSRLNLETLGDRIVPDATAPAATPVTDHEDVLAHLGDETPTGPTTDTISINGVGVSSTDATGTA